MIIRPYPNSDGDLSRLSVCNDVPVDICETYTKCIRDYKPTAGPFAFSSVCTEKLKMCRMILTPVKQLDLITSHQNFWNFQKKNLLSLLPLLQTSPKISHFPPDLKTKIPRIIPFVRLQRWLTFTNYHSVNLLTSQSKSFEVIINLSQCFAGILDVTCINQDNWRFWKCFR